MFVVLTHRPWQDPTDAAAAAATARDAPGPRHDPLTDLRLVSWNLGGLRYRGPGDQQALSVAAQSIWACLPDLVALQVGVEAGVHLWHCM